MTSKPPAESSGLPRGGILLVEEYGALQVAITSALRKFAPSHKVQIAHNFAEAEATAEQMRPDLFLLDLDPPPSGEITIFQRLKARYPEARMLVLAPGTSRELRKERGTSGAIQFIEKPFDLGEFGAAVQALLGPWTLPHSFHSRGTLFDLHLIDLVQLKCLALSNGVLRLETDDGHSGAIYFRRGQMCHAVTGTLEGAEAFAQMADWTDWHLSETDLPSDLPATINVAWPGLLLPVARRLTVENQKKSVATTPSRQSSSTGHVRKKILIVDDTEMLLIFVADTLATADPALQIITASTGAEGIRLAAIAQPDLILLDYSLTDMSGDKVCQMLLEDPSTVRIPVLMMSGHLTELARTARNYRNVSAALAKPFLSNALITEVERLLSAGALPEVRPMPSHPMAMFPPAKSVVGPENPVPGSPLLSASRLPEAQPPPAEPETTKPKPEPTTERTPEPAVVAKGLETTPPSAAPDPVLDVESAPELAPSESAVLPKSPAESSPSPAVDSLPVEPPKPVEPSVAVPPPVSADTEQEKAEAQPALSSEPVSQSALLSGEPIVAHISLEPEPSNKTPGASSSNGHANNEPAPTPSRAAEEPVVQLARESRETTVFEAQKSVATAKRPAASRTTPSTSFVRPTEVSVTLALEVVSMQLTSSFRMEAATLQPCNPVVSVKMDERSDLRGVPLENGFRLGTIRLFDDGMIDTMRLVPTRRKPQLPAAKSSFAIGEMSLERTNSHENLQFTAQKTEAMRVLLTTRCELVAVELSVAFEVVAVMLRAREKTVLIRNTQATAGADFALEGVELNAVAELCGLLVRAVT